MSKRTRKKQTQTANYLTLSAREQSPKVGSIVEQKNAIIVKKQEGDSVDVFYTDQNGKVMQIKSTPVSEPTKSEEPNIVFLSNPIGRPPTAINAYLVKKDKVLTINIELINPEMLRMGEKISIGYQDLVSLQEEKVVFTSAGTLYLNTDGSVEFMIMATSGELVFSVSAQVILAENMRDKPVFLPDISDFPPPFGG